MRDRILKLSLHGVTAGTPPRHETDFIRGERGECSGWSARSSRSNKAFLFSVDYEALVDSDGQPLEGIALTLTVRDCPPTHDHWKKLREAYFLRLRRSGLVAGHWVTEWQRRGVPHMHGAFYFPAGTLTPEFVKKLLSSWVSVSAQYGSMIRSQYATPIHDALGWFQYTAKHMARGHRHYQRSPENVPQSWKQKTGRMWGKIGSWPETEPVELTLTDDEFYRFRRIVRGWRVAHHRGEMHQKIENHGLSEFHRFFSGYPDQVQAFFQLEAARRFLRSCPDYRFFRQKIRFAKKMLSSNSRGISSVRGISEWVPFDWALSMALAAQAASVHRRAPVPDLTEVRK